MSKIRFEFSKNLSVLHNRETGSTITYYKDAEMTSKLTVLDAKSAKEFGISPQEYRLAEVLAHHIIGILYFKEESSPIIHSITYKEPVPEFAEFEKWLVDGVINLTYIVYKDTKALEELAVKDINPYKLRDKLLYLVNIPEFISQVKINL